MTPPTSYPSSHHNKLIPLHYELDELLDHGHVTCAPMVQGVGPSACLVGTNTRYTMGIWGTNTIQCCFTALCPSRPQPGGQLDALIQTLWCEQSRSWPLTWLEARHRVRLSGRSGLREQLGVYSVGSQTSLRVEGNVDLNPDPTNPTPAG